jgi:hypothetical protein
MTTINSNHILNIIDILMSSIERHHTAVYKSDAPFSRSGTYFKTTAWHSFPIPPLKQEMEKCGIKAARCFG